MMKISDKVTWQQSALSANIIFCLSGAKLLSPGETIMPHCSNKDTDISASQISWWYVDTSYEELKNRSHNVKTSDVTFICPYCPRRKQDYLYRELLEHAYMVGRSSSEKRSARERANHLALVKYLENDLIIIMDGPSEPVDKGNPPVNEVAISVYNFFFNSQVTEYEEFCQFTKSVLTLIFCLRY